MLHVPNNTMSLYKIYNPAEVEEFRRETKTFDDIDVFEHTHVFSERDLQHYFQMVVNQGYIPTSVLEEYDIQPPFDPYTINVSMIVEVLEDSNFGVEVFDLEVDDNDNSYYNEEY